MQHPMKTEGCREKKTRVPKATHTVWAMPGLGNKPGLEDRRIPERAGAGSASALLLCAPEADAAGWRGIRRRDGRRYLSAHMQWGPCPL